MFPSTAHPPAGRAPRLLALAPPPPVALRQPPSVPPPPPDRLDGYRLRLAHRPASLYQQLFPDAPAWRQTDVPTDGDGLLLAIEHFLSQVNRERFPVIDELWEDELEDADWRLWQIPLDLQGLAVWDEEEWNYYPEPTRLLLYLGSWSNLDEDEADYPAANEPAADEPVAGSRFLKPAYPYAFPHDFRLDGLAAVLAEMALPAPLDGLPDLITLALADGDNGWLDYTNNDLAECGGCFPSWDEWPEWYQAWQAAEPILQRVKRLVDWVKQAPAERLDAVVAALLAGHRGR
jgi:hypothetical protein